MRNILTLTKHELTAYFLSPLAYVIMTAFLFFVGVIFYQTLMEYPNSEAMRNILGLTTFLTIIIMPMVTMRLLAEEKRSGTLEMLMTAPITEIEVVISKFLGGLVFYIFLIIPTVVYVILLVAWGHPDLGSLIAWYLGLLFLGAVCVAIGLFVSAFTSNQIVAAIITFVILIIEYWIIPWAANTISQLICSLLNLVFGAGRCDSFLNPLGKTLKYLGFEQHLVTLSKGLLDSRDVIFFLSVVVIFLFLTVRILESRRWK